MGKPVLLVLLSSASSAQTWPGLARVQHGHDRSARPLDRLAGVTANWEQAQSSFFTFNPLDFAHFCRANDQIDAKGSNLPRRPRTRPSCYRHAHPRLLGHLHLFDAADVLSAHLAVAICAKLPQFSSIATNCNCIPSVLLACLLRPLLANAFNRDPPPGHVELGP